MLTNNILDSNLGNQLRRVNRKQWGKLINFSLPPLLWMGIILLLVGMPGYRFPNNELFSADKLIHFGLYFVLSFLWMQAFIKQSSIPMLRFEGGFYTLLIGFLYSGLTEILQGLLFIQRSADLIDYLANSMGTLAGYWFFRFFIRK